jgi:rieske iron-sulfur protein
VNWTENLKRSMPFERRAFLKLLLGLSGVSALLHFVGYGNYLSTEAMMLNLEAEHKTESATEMSTVTYVQPEIRYERKKITNLSQIPPGSQMIFTWPPELGATGKNLLTRDDAGNLHAFNLVCTHLRCLARFEPKFQLIVCPCHGSAFKPYTGEVKFGPAQAALPVIILEVDEEGDIYAVGHDGDFGSGRECRSDCGQSQG